MGTINVRQRIRVEAPVGNGQLDQSSTRVNVGWIYRADTTSYNSRIAEQLAGPGSTIVLEESIMGTTHARRRGMTVILGIIIIVIVCIGFFQLFRLLQSSDTSGPDIATGDSTPTPIPTTWDVIVAAHDLPRGTRLGLQDVTVAAWPITVAMPAGALIIGRDENSAGLEQVKERIARVDILSGQLILDHMLTPRDQWEDDDITADSDFARIVRLQTDLTETRKELEDAQTRIKELEAELAGENSTSSP